MTISPWRRTFILLICLLLSLSLAGCGGAQLRQRLPASTPTMSLEVKPDPPGVGPTHLTVQLADAKGLPLTGAEVEIEADMGHPGMKPLRVKALAGADGHYEAPFKWTMAGEWQLTINVALPGGQTAQQQLDLTVAGGQPAAAGHAHGQPKRIPNKGAMIWIVAPEAGSVFQIGEEIWVEIEYDNFNLGKGNHHWHLYLDDEPGQMIMGEMTQAVLRNLEPGEHQLSTYLSIGGHEELEEGASITITVVDPGKEKIGQEKDQVESGEGHSGGHNHGG